MVKGRRLQAGLQAVQEGGRYMMELPPLIRSALWGVEHPTPLLQAV